MFVHNTCLCVCVYVCLCVYELVERVYCVYTACYICNALTEFTKGNFYCVCTCN